jgi:hypothetical protein
VPGFFNLWQQLWSRFFSKKPAAGGGFRLLLLVHAHGTDA